jgi:hypothetical protein
MHHSLEWSTQPIYATLLFSVLLRDYSMGLKEEGNLPELGIPGLGSWDTLLALANEKNPKTMQLYYEV